MKALISIIMPLFNKAEQIETTIKSVMHQDEENWELILIDDGSTDGGLEKVQQLLHGDARLKCLEKPDALAKGPSSSRNLGAQKSEANWLLFLDADDVLAPNAISQRLAIMAEHQEADFVVFPQGKFYETLGDSKDLFSTPVPSTEEALACFLADKPCWQTSGPVWQKSAFLRLGGFKEDWKMMEDPELHLRALLNKLQWHFFTGEATFFYRLPQPGTAQNLEFWKVSALGRMAFYRHILTKLLNTAQKAKYQSHLQEGILASIKCFMLSRVHHFPKEWSAYWDFVQRQGVLSPQTIKRVNHYLKFKALKVPFFTGLAFRKI